MRKSVIRLTKHSAGEYSYKHYRACRLQFPLDGKKWHVYVCRIPGAVRYFATLSECRQFIRQHEAQDNG